MRCNLRADINELDSGDVNFGARGRPHLRSPLTDQSENDHHEAEAADGAGDLTHGPHQRGGIVGLRRNRHHADKKRRRDNDQNATDNHNPPIPLPHAVCPSVSMTGIDRIRCSGRSSPPWRSREETLDHRLLFKTKAWAAESARRAAINACRALR